MLYDLHFTQFERRKEGMSIGKSVDSGNNLVARIGGSGSFTSMVVSIRIRIITSNKASQ